MKRKKILFFKQIGPYHLTCTITSRQFEEKEIGVGDILNLKIRIRHQGHQAYGRTSKPVFLCIDPSDFFEPIYEEGMLNQANSIPLNALRDSSQQELKAWFVIKARVPLFRHASAARLALLLDKLIQLRITNCG